MTERWLDEIEKYFTSADDDTWDYNYMEDHMAKAIAHLRALLAAEKAAPTDIPELRKGLLEDLDYWWDTDDMGGHWCPESYERIRAIVAGQPLLPPSPPASVKPKVNLADFQEVVSVFTGRSFAPDAGPLIDWLESRGVEFTGDAPALPAAAKAKPPVTHEKAAMVFRTFWGRINAEEPPACAWDWFWPMLKEMGISVVPAMPPAKEA